MDSSPPATAGAQKGDVESGKPIGPFLKAKTNLPETSKPMEIEVIDNSITENNEK